MSSERQLATTWEDVREDHRQRYGWADTKIVNSGFGHDFFCGVGYGTWYLARYPGRFVVGVDADQAAIMTAREHFKREGYTAFIEARWPEGYYIRPRSGSYAICLESVEHVEDGDGLIRHLARSLMTGGVLVFSTPNSDVLPKINGTWPHHHRHYSLAEALDWANLSDFSEEDPVQLQLVDWAGQDVYVLDGNGRVKSILEQPIIKPQTAGQFTLVAARRIT